MKGDAVPARSAAGGGGGVELRSTARSSWYADARLTECGDWDEQDPDAYRALAAPRGTGEVHVRRFDDADPAGRGPAGPGETDPHADLDADLDAVDQGDLDTLIDELRALLLPDGGGSGDPRRGLGAGDDGAPKAGLYAALGLAEEEAGRVSTEQADLDLLGDEDLVALEDPVPGRGDAPADPDEADLVELAPDVLEPIDDPPGEPERVQGAAPKVRTRGPATPTNTAEDPRRGAVQRTVGLASSSTAPRIARRLWRRAMTAAA